MKDDLSERKLKILQAVLGDFISSAEPVGSRTISKKYDMGVSAATIRNEMSDLEDMGYLTHLHTSAGRIPSEKAYRFYVDSLMGKHDLSQEDRAAIDKMMTAGYTELDRTLKHASELLSHLTNLASFAMTPDEDKNTLKYVNLLPVDERTVVLMIVAESGKITNTALRLRTEYDPESLQLMSKVLTHNYKGRTLSSIVTMNIIDDIQKDAAALSGMAKDIIPSFMSTLESMLNIDLYVNGLENVFSIPEYNRDMEKAKSFIDVLSSKDKLTKVLMERDEGINITIGNENDDQNLKDCSLITATYSVNGKCVGKLGVIGPTRMRYSEITSIIEYLTNNLNIAFRLTEGDQKDGGEQEENNSEG
ncbi:MAG: heat-inducible transcriptional repressor HrcA [Clostridia bacterium]|nr:heat-inducible transcriptional repressor HrcA [Clostridia bacterium]